MIQATIDKQQILELTCKKHVKIWKLKQLGLTNKEIADATGTNSGHVYNALKDYANKPEKVQAAEKI